MYTSTNSTSIIDKLTKETVYQIAKIFCCVMCALESFFFHWYLFYYYKNVNSFNEELIFKEIHIKVLLNIFCPRKNIDTLIRNRIAEKKKEMNEEVGVTIWEQQL
jgi:hypothetical protein